MDEENPMDNNVEGEEQNPEMEAGEEGNDEPGEEGDFGNSKGDFENDQGEVEVEPGEEGEGQEGDEQEDDENEEGQEFEDSQDIQGSKLDIGEGEDQEEHAEGESKKDEGSHATSSKGFGIKSEEGELQLTDYGISGICVFNLSHLFYRIKGKKKVLINFMPFIDNEVDLIKYLDNRNNIMNNKKVSELLNGILNNKVIKAIIKKSNINDISYKSLSLIEKENLCKTILNYEMDILSTKSFDKAQTCMGGVYLSEIDTHTMKVKNIDNLYITGEVLDCDGVCGGYNLTFAFITGFKAGTNI